jgi:hypothetical protein
LPNFCRWKRSGRRGLGGGDGREDNTVLGHGYNSDDDGGGRGGDNVVLMAEEEQDGMVPGHGGEGRADGVEAVGVATMWTQRRRRGRGKFWQLDSVQVKILRSTFKDRAVRGFIGGQQ